MFWRFCCTFLAWTGIEFHFRRAEKNSYRLVFGECFLYIISNSDLSKRWNIFRRCFFSDKLLLESVWGSIWPPLGLEIGTEGPRLIDEVDCLRTLANLFHMKFFSLVDRDVVVVAAIIDAPSFTWRYFIYLDATILTWNIPLFFLKIIIFSYIKRSIFRSCDGYLIDY